MLKKLPDLSDNFYWKPLFFLEDLMDKRAGKAITQRQLQISEQIRHILAWVFERGFIREPAIRDLIITVTEVRVSPDLRNASVFFLPLGGNQSCDIGDVLRGLNKAAPYFRKQLSKSMQLRKVPNLKFVSDVSFETASYIDGLLKTPFVKQDLIKSNHQKKYKKDES